MIELSVFTSRGASGNSQAGHLNLALMLSSVLLVMAGLYFFMQLISILEIFCIMGQIPLLFN